MNSIAVIMYRHRGSLSFSSRLTEAGLELRARAEKIELGDTVMLRSGGPRMTVGQTNVGGDPSRVETVWFDGGCSVAMSGQYPASALRRCAP